MSGKVDLQSHLLRMRVTAVVGFVVVVVSVVAAFVLPYRGSAVAAPRTVTLVALAATLWIGFSANRDANGRLAKIRRAFAVPRLGYAKGYRSPKLKAVRFDF